MLFINCNTLCNKNIIINNICSAQSENILTDGYIIKNKNANKIYNLLNYIYSPVDFVFMNLRNDNKINSLMLTPLLVEQNKELESHIG